ncbi:deoxyribonuclease [Streptococcus sp. BJSWXB6CM1]|uniref:Deoxyribonuclease n=1 Tax=Streptococcus fermentans TaxID=3095082 RepID=A0ABU5G0J0_9STRE|nr:MULTISPECIES: deoxyribonuclease [unclassified Streptococcus]MDY4346665.1 deoxyribonuclease [Streptococcus sp. BJSWXB5TM5]MDY4361680.1 deoxyribonuclease [Streptococcus sp. BJSWXB3CM3]MDY4371870.1 deoxyribonuclease [Streptococcus sp. BJSWXB6CM1]
MGIILLIALPTLYLVLSGVGIWYFVKKAPDIRKRNLMIGLFIVSFVAVALQTPTVTKKTSSAQSETKQTVTSTSSTTSTTDTSSSIEEAKRIEDEKKAKEKAEEERIAKEKAANELQEKGEALVKQLEESQDANQVKSAKETVNQIENNDKKTELIDRIGAVESLISQKEEEKRIAREAEIKAQQQDRTVYVAKNGQAKVYWYNKDRMPSNTNKANVVEMTEADAIAAGKTPSKKE